MKYSHTTLIFLIFFSLGTFLNAADTTTTANEKKVSPAKKAKQKVEKKQKKQLDFIDLNANGIDDRLERGGMKKGRGKGKKMRKDRFIDLDGDGICDGKESAIGLRKLYRKRKGKPGGK